MTPLGIVPTWKGLITRYRDEIDANPPNNPTLTVELQRSAAGCSPMLCLADDGVSYWVKFPSNPNGTQVLVAETIVAELGLAMAAPVVRARRVEVPAAWSGLRFGPNGMCTIGPGLAHGSPLIPHAIERADKLSFPRRDGNAQRIPRLAVLWDWAMGEDPQWLYDPDHDSSIWSFDHGMWLDAAEGPWTTKSLTTVAQAAWGSPGGIPKTVDGGEFLNAAYAIEHIQETAVASAVAQVPRQWEPDDALLADLAETLWKRRHGAAARARTMSASYPGRG